jgi:hypothetical protein
MGKRSIELVRREFDLNVVADRYADLYRQLLSTGRPSDDQIAPFHHGHRRRAAHLHSSRIS